MDSRFDIYLRKLRETPLDQHTEHTGRGALETLLNTFAGDAMARGMSVQHEPRREAGKGAPDFKIKNKGMILGYIEVKAVGADLNAVVKTEQIKKYLSLSQNIIVTDYLRFIWISDGKARPAVTLADQGDLESRIIRVNPQKAEEVSKLLAAFFSTAPQGIGRAKALAEALAARSRLLRDFLTQELIRQEQANGEGRLHALFDVFKTQVFHELTTKEFADAFAQTLAYGLFLARLNAKDEETVTLLNVRQFIPGSFTLIRELVRFLEDMNEREYDDVKWVVDEILSIVNGLELARIREDLSFRQRKAISRNVRAQDEEEHRLFERDPFIYFYEDYLKAYDKDTRKGRGVYYTPPPVVNFIVRAVDDILKDKFRIADGLADSKKVTVLDFACGTGTFLLEVFEKIFENIGGPDSGKADLVVREHILKNLFGFEYLIAPYTIAHLKLSQYLKDKGHGLQEQDRLQVFLTNTLEPVSPQKNAFLPQLSAEVEAAQKVKEQPVLVILGNPPYSGHSKNKGAWITSSIAEYRKGFPELSKPAQGKWLQDDYVKFIRFAQMKIDGGTYEVEDESGQIQTITMKGVDRGIVGIISNHSWLDNPTFKGMRKSLMETFDQIFVLDLHGNAKKKEHSSDGSKDENVFDIEQGVAIAFFVKGFGLEKRIVQGDLFGKRLKKYQNLAGLVADDAIVNVLQPASPDWLLKPQDEKKKKTYQKYWAIPQIFSALGDPAPGFVTTHDEFAISFTSKEAVKKVEKLISTKSENEARSVWKLCKQSQWNYKAAKENLEHIDLTANVVAVDYRPFDRRFTIWDKHVAVHRRERVNQHLLSKNLAIVVSRQAGAIGGLNFDAACVVEYPVDFNYFRRGGEYIFPIYKMVPEISESFSTEFRDWLHTRYQSHFSSECTRTVIT